MGAVLAEARPERQQGSVLQRQERKTTQLDIGAQYNGKRFNGWVSAYVGRVDDFILFKYDPHNARLSRADNVNANIMGGEMGMGYQLSEHWKTDASPAYSGAKHQRRPAAAADPAAGGASGAHL